MMERFENKKEVILEESNFLTSCTTLPLLYEGHVIGKIIVVKLEVKNDISF